MEERRFARHLTLQDVSGLDGPDPVMCRVQGFYHRPRRIFFRDSKCSLWELRDGKANPMYVGTMHEALMYRCGAPWGKLRSHEMWQAAELNGIRAYSMNELEQKLQEEHVADFFGHPELILYRSGLGFMYWALPTAPQLWAYLKKDDQGPPLGCSSIRSIVPIEAPIPLISHAAQIESDENEGRWAPAGTVRL